MLPGGGKAPVTRPGIKAASRQWDGRNAGEGLLRRALTERRKKQPKRAIL